jgi:tryptophanyl-tRNA synthetase
MVFVQSHNPIHAQLNWILACNVQYGELTRMTQFKDKSAKHPENINGGLLTYPVLMAADILAYNAAAVPVGIDQKQHVELARNIAQRFNSVYGETFVMPEAVIPKVGAKIMSLQDPTKKMSKSDENQNNIITLMDDPKVIMNKMKRAMTDSDNEIRFAEDKPGISNLLSIYCAVTGKTIQEAEREFAGMGYGTFKTAVGEAVVADLEPVQKRVKELEANKDYLDAIIKDGAEKASRLADRTLSKVQRKVGFPARIR